MRGGMSAEGAVLCGWIPALPNALVMLALGVVGTLVLVARGVVPRAVLWPLLLITGALVAAGAAVGVSHATGVVVVLVYRLLSFWIPLAVGLVVAARLERATRHPEAVAPTGAG